MRYARSILHWKSHWQLPALAVAALCSGAASLSLEVVWSKALVVPLGNSSDATAMVLSGFMLGIAGGARVGAKLAQRTTRPLLVYAGLELLLAILAWNVPKLLPALSALALPSSLASVHGAAFGLRLTAAFCLVTLPCLIMGATLPLLFATSVSKATPRLVVGVLYGVNTLGATLAASVVGFYGVAEWGIVGCSWRAAICSLLAALIATAAGAVDRSLSPADPRHEKPDPDQENAASASDSAAREAVASASSSTTDRASDNETGSAIHRPTDDGSSRDVASERHALVATFAAGFALLAAEVFWARILTFVFGHDTYAFATLLSVVLLGLALGGLGYVGLSRRDPRQVAGWSMALVAVTLLASFYAAAWLSIRWGRDPFAIGDRNPLGSALSGEILREFAYTPVLVLIPCLLSGIAYPATIALYAGARGSLSRATGAIGLANGIGATLGAAVTSLGLVAWLGIQGVLSCIALALALVAAWLMSGATKPRTRWVAAALTFGITAGCVLLAPKDLPRRMLLSVVGARHQTLLHYQEARTATVSVIRNSIHGERQLLVNAVNEVTTRLVHDQSFKLLGQLGPLLHPDPKTAVMICLGAGLAAGSALTHPLDRLEVVDLLQAVRYGAAHFAEENNHVLDDPRLVLHVNDGRQFLLTTQRQYDLAIVDSTHPKSVDSWILYTREFFQLLRSRLAPDGIAVQWLPLHGLSEREFLAVVATFESVFPEMTLWASVGYETYGHVGYAKLVGQNSDAPMRFDVSQMQERLMYPRVQADLQRYGMGSLPEILDQFIAGPERIREWTAGSPRLSDDRPFLAYLTGLSRGLPMTPDRLVVVREPVLPYLVDRGGRVAPSLDGLERAFDAQGFVVSGRLDQALALHPTGDKLRLYAEQTKTSLAYYTSLAARYPEDPERLFEAGTQLGALGHPREARTVLEAGLRLRPHSLRLGLNLGLLRLSAADARGAAAEFSALIAEHDRASILHQNLGVALLAQAEPGAARRELMTATALDPQSTGAALALAEAELALSNLARAKELLQGVLSAHPHHAEATTRLAQVLERLGEHAQALEHFTRAAKLDPYAERRALDLGTRLIASDLQRASALLSRAERLHPHSAAVRVALGDMFLRLEQWQNASQAFVLALELDPREPSAALGLGRALAHQNQMTEATAAICLARKLGIAVDTARAELIVLGRRLEDCGRDLTSL